MSFPKSPTKKVTGKLSLTVRPAKQEFIIESGSGLDTGEGTDDDALKFKGPRGYKVFSSLEEVLDKQFSVANDRLEEMLVKAGNCGSCDKELVKLAAENSQALFGRLRAALDSASLGQVSRISVVVGQETNSCVTASITLNNKEVSFIIEPVKDRESCYSVGVYKNDSLVTTLMNSGLEDVMSVFNLAVI